MPTQGTDASEEFRRRTLSEKAFTAETNVSRVRLLLVIGGTIYTVIAWGEPTLRPGWMVGLLALAWPYAALVLWLEPYRRWHVVRSSALTITTDAIFTAAWVFATGGVVSPWVPVYLGGIVAVSARFGHTETIVSAIFYAASYIFVGAMLGQLWDSWLTISVHIVCMGLVAVLAGPIAAETLRQSLAQKTMAELARITDEAKAKLRGLLEAARVPIVMWDDAGLVQLVNGPAEELFGVVGSTAVGRASDDLAGANSAWRQVHDLWQQAVQDGELEERLRIPRADGEFREVVANVTPYRPAAGRGGVIAVLYDETERVRLARRVQGERIRAEEAERHRIARELHDEIGQILTGLKFTVELAQRNPERASLDEASRSINELMNRVRNLSLDLRPAVLDDLGLVPALLRLFDRYTAATRVEVMFNAQRIDRRFSTDVETAAYRIVQEAINNVAKHAATDSVRVRASCAAGELYVEVQDDGVGFDANVADHRGTGLAGMRERALLVGGECLIESEAGKGTLVVIALPVADPSSV